MLILLDIDGVMVPANSWKKPELLKDDFMAFSPRATKALDNILAETGANILLTTSHRDNFTMDEWRKIFNRRKIRATKLKKLPQNKNQLNRKQEILKWYNSKGLKEKFVIIDDDKSLNGLPEFLKTKLVRTDSSIGLTDYHAKKAIEKLEGLKYQTA